MNKVEIIRSVHDGDRLDFELSEHNIAAFRSRASELNKLDGWRHYRIAASVPLNLMSIIANLKEDGNK
jgi:hypothetical protein